MPKLPVLSGADIVAIPEQLGFRQVRQRGSHVVMRRDGVGCVVPLHREVRTGTLAGILRQAQVNPEAFLEAAR